MGDPVGGDTIVALAGDWHGNIPWALARLRYIASRGVRTVYHLGDFGIWPGASGKKYLYRLYTLAQELDITIWVTPGNHEDWERLNAVYARGDGPQQLVPNIWVLPRGHRWTHAGRSFVSLGGAPSIDFEFRSVNRDWWLEEQILPEHVATVAAGGYADVMLAHDAPTGGTEAVEAIVGGNPQGWSAQAREYAAEGRRLMTQAYEAVGPRLFAHGHYHVQGDTGPASARRVLSLNCDGGSGNVVFLDLAAEDFGVEWMPATWSLASRL